MTLPAVLANLPAPEIIEELSVETILSTKISALNTQYSLANLDYSASMLVYDPAVIQAQVASYDEMLLRQRINEAVRAQMLPFATGADLDILAAFYDVARLFNESDDRLRERVVLAIQGRSTGGTEPRYTYIALSADVRVADAVVYTIGRDPTIHVAIFSTDNDGVADSELLETVNAALQSPEVRMVNDTIVVAAAARQAITISADVWLLPQTSGSVIDDMETALREAWSKNMALGRDLTRAWLTSKLMLDGVQRVEVIQPVSDVAMPFNEAAAIGSITLDYKGRDY